LSSLLSGHEGQQPHRAVLPGVLFDLGARVPLRPVEDQRLDLSRFGVNLETVGSAVLEIVP
jgi:hypothetical protein